MAHFLGVTSKGLDVDAIGIGGKDPMTELRNEVPVMARCAKRFKGRVDT